MTSRCLNIVLAGFGPGNATLQLQQAACQFKINRESQSAFEIRTRKAHVFGPKWDDLHEERCSIARTVSVIGDRWSLLALRDCFLSIRRLEDFQQRLGILHPKLVDRLRKLVDEKVWKKVAYQESHVHYQYRLTAKGMALHPILMGIVHWGDVHMAGRAGGPLLHRHVKCGHLFNPITVCSECHAGLTARNVAIKAGLGS